jgi:transcriptional regulator with XRE-family HTH domain
MLGMRHSLQKHNVARLRAFLNKSEKLDQAQFAKMIGWSVCKLQNIETGRTKLDEELATKLLTETHISPEWLLVNDLKAPLVSANGDPYTFEIFERAQAEKETEKGKGLFYRGHWYFRLTNAIGFCAQLFAILESASARKDYFMGAYKVGKALDSLRNEFGQNFHIYDVIHSPHLVIRPSALEVLRHLLDHGQKELDKSNQRPAALMARRKRSSSQRRKKKRA